MSFENDGRNVSDPSACQEYTHKLQAKVLRNRKEGRGNQEPKMTSPYLDRPLLPLAVPLPRMLEKVGVELTTAGPAEAQHLRHRAQLILDLLTPQG